MMFSRTNLCLLLSTAFVALSASAQELSEKTWRKDPRIVEVRALYEATNKLLRDKRLKAAYGGDACGSLLSQRSKFTDEHGVVRRYVDSSGSDDSAVTFDHTYDARGQLRFVFVRAGAVNDTDLQVRFYFDAAGKLLWQDRRETGPGYTFVDFEEHLARSPKTAFVERIPCH